MNLSTRRRDESLWKRLLSALQSRQNHDIVHSQAEFQLELAKEISRSNRRQYQREFALVHFSVPTDGPKSVLSEEMLNSFRQRIRITDTVGWHSSNLAFLLPETDREGAKPVTLDLVKLAARHGWDVEPKVYVYPWDDELVSISNQIALADSGEKQDAADDESHNSGPRDFDDGFHRVDASQSDRVRPYLESGFRNNGFHNSSPQLNQDGLSTQGVAVVESPPEVLKHDDVRQSLTSAEEIKLNAVASSISTSMVETIHTPVWKRVIDIVGAGTGLIVLSPVLLAAAIAIKATSPGPVFFRQRREGKGGKPFDILKFRTMVVDAEEKQASLRGSSEQDGPAFKLKDDPRITSVGKKLRQSCVDELPQLVNVLMGQMSLVGPRPLPVSESVACSPWQRMRLTVLPGLTCTWQARGGRNVSFDQWMRMDLDYIRNQSLVSDVRLIVETAFIALLQRGSV